MSTVEAEPTGGSTNPYHRGNFAPVHEEVTHTDLRVTGSLPPALDGRLLRAGPNPVGEFPEHQHWFLGDGMIHGIEISGGEARSYRNRWVRTPRVAEVTGLDTPAPNDVEFGSGGVNIVGHAGRILALGEVGRPWEMSPELDTLGRCDFGGELATSMTAHPKIDAETGEMLFFGYDFGPVHLRYHRVAADGSLVQTIEIETPKPTMVHDFAVTEKWVVFMDLPVVFAPELLANATMPFAWDDDYQARLGVIARDGSDPTVRWFAIDPCYVFHPMNAFDRGDEIVMDVARHETMFRTSQLGPNEPTGLTLDRWTINLASGVVSEDRVNDRPQEFPRVDPRRDCREHRYGYSVLLDRDHDSTFLPTGVIKTDLASGTTDVHDFGPGRRPSEAVMVPDTTDAAEGEGWLLSVVYDEASDRSDVVVLDATDLSADPVAIIHLPVRVPYGFHGNWICN